MMGHNKSPSARLSDDAYSRESVIRPRDKNHFLIGAAIGSGTAALAAQRGGADFLLAINAGRFRNMGAPSIACMLPVFNADQLVESFARRELITQCDIPVLIGVNAWGEQFNPSERAAGVRSAGFAGATNFPSCMHFSRPMQQILSRAGRGIEREVEMLRAVQDAGLTSMFYCATRTQARLAADAGIDLVCLNLGWNVGGALGHMRRISIEEVAALARGIGSLIKRINPATSFLLEGGPIGDAQDLGKVLALTTIDGYVGGSTLDRIPLENSVAEQIQQFRLAAGRVADLDAASTRLVSWARRFDLIGRCGAHLDFLKQLRVLSATHGPVSLLLESGMNVKPVVDALNASGGGRNVETVYIDGAGEESPNYPRRLLFGHRDTLDRQAPLLADPGIGFVVIFAPQSLSSATQRRLARALQHQVFTPIGARRPVAVKARIILVCEVPVISERGQDYLGATGLERELSMVMAGGTLRMPPLRDRVDDLSAIIQHVSSESFGVSIGRSHFSPPAFALLQAYDWPGNELELKSVLGTLAGRLSKQPFQEEDLMPLLHGGSDPAPGARTEKERVLDALWRNGFNRTRTARALGVSRKTLYNKIRKYDLLG